MKYALNRTIPRERGCAEKPELCNLIGDSEEVKGRSTRNSNARKSRGMRRRSMRNVSRTSHRS